MSGYLDSLKTYVEFTDEDTRRLQALLPLAQGYLTGFAGHFYERIVAHPAAHAVLDGPEQVERLSQTLCEWMRSGLAGPHDQAFYERRARIGRVHVHIGLPQQYMFTAMNILRLDFHHMLAEVYAGDLVQERMVRDSVDKLLDLELAIMLRTYHEQLEARLRRSERLATIGQVAASIGHDLRNPLSVVQSSLYIIGRRMGDDPQVSRHLERIKAQVEQCDSIIDNLLQLARNRPPRLEFIDFQEIMGKVVSALRVPAHLHVSFSVADGLHLRADAGLLCQAVINLVDNAIKAYGPAPGVIYVSAHNDDGGHVIIEVADDGPGFTIEAITEAFEPLVTTRDTGTGLGLALVKGITERHGGTVEAFNRPTGGAAVRLRLPVQESDQSGEADGDAEGESES